MAVKDLSQLGLLFTDRRDFYLGDFITRELYGDVAPFITVASNRGVKNCTDPDYKMFEHRSSWVKQKCKVNDDAVPAWGNAGAVGEEVETILDTYVGLPSPVDSSCIGLMLEVWAGTTYKGVVRIQKLGTGSHHVVLQVIGNPKDAAMKMAALADNDDLYVVGNAFGEGGYAPDANSDELEVVYNSCQEFKTSIEVTGTLLAAALRGYSKELERLRLEKGKEHKMQKERDFLFGVRSGGTGSQSIAGTVLTDSFSTILKDKDGKNLRTTMGIIPAIQRYGATTGDKQNIFTVSAATYDYNSFVDDTEKVFQYIPDSGEKVAFCGLGAMSYWNKVGTAGTFVGNTGFNVNINNFEHSELGYNFRRLISPHGIIRLVPTPALNGPYNKSMLIVDDSDLSVMQYRPFVFKTNVKTDDDYDGVKDVYKSDEGLAITLIEKHSLWTITA